MATPEPRAARVDAAVLLGLAGIAVSQPLLDLLGSEPELFIAAHYSRAQIIGLVVLITVGPAALAIAMVALLGTISTRAASIAQLTFSRSLIVLFSLRVARQLGFDRLVPYAVVAIGLSIALVEAFDRLAGLRQFVRYLAITSLLFPLLFFTASRSSALLATAPDTEAVTVSGLDGPVVVIVLDELPLTTLLRADGTINADRFPTFAALADESTWFRNASSPSADTARAVPAMLTGLLPNPDVLASYHDRPRNLLTLFAPSAPVHRFEAVSDLCPPDLCTPMPSRPLLDVANDLAVVFGHRVLPTALRERLPEVDEAWGDFGKGTSYRDDGPRDGEWRARGNTLAAGEARRLIDLGQQIDVEPALHVFHVVTPHSRWTISPWGYENASEPTWAGPADSPASKRADIQEYQTHVMQVGAADQALGEVVAHMKANGSWDDALVVVASDHGISLLPPDRGKRITDRNIDAVLRVPLFIKAPGQRAGRVDDSSASTIDVLPSIIDLLDIDVDWQLDGHSLFDGSRPSNEPLVTNFADALEIVRAHSRDFGADTWRGLAAVGDQRDLVGTKVDDHSVGEPSELRWDLRDRSLLRDLPAEGVRVPYLLRGTIRGTAARPPDLVVAVDGDIGGTIGGYDSGERDGTWELRGTITDAYHDGANDVRAYEVERTSSGIVLHEVRAA